MCFFYIYIECVKIISNDDDAPIGFFLLFFLGWLLTRALKIESFTTIHFRTFIFTK